MVATSPAISAPGTQTHVYRHYGAVSQLFWLRSRELLIAGPAGTGKSRGCMEKINALCWKYPGTRHLFTRKTLTELSAAALVDFRKWVLLPNDGVVFFGGNKEKPAAYVYPNGSEIVVGGLDDSRKIMSTQYDTAYVQEASDVEEEDIENLQTRLRNNAMPYQQLLMDCNPQGPDHWLLARCNRGDCRLLVSLHKDNPTVTPEYLAALSRLTGVRRERLYLGIWAAAEGVVYEEFSRKRHVIDGVETALPRFQWHFASQDWGFTNPGVFGIWGVTGDGVAVLIHEIYQTGKTVDGYWVPAVRPLHKHYRLRSIQCDPSEPDFIQQYINAGLPAVKANNAIPPGVGAVQERLARDRVLFWSGALRQRDEALVAEHKPFSTIQEFPAYVWPKNVAGKPVKEKPQEGDDHGMDMVRYAIASLDIKPVAQGKAAVMPQRATFVPR